MHTLGGQVPQRLPCAQGRWATATARMAETSWADIAFGCSGERRGLGINAARPYCSARRTHR